MKVLVRKASEFVRGLLRHHSRRPLENLTYDEAESYLDNYSAMMEEGVGLIEKESSLPTSFERMKEAFKVECLRMCNLGADFDKTAELLLPGYMRLANFLPDDLAEKASPARRRELCARLGTALNSPSVLQSLQEVAHAGKTACNYSEARMNELNIEWNLFVERFRKKYSSTP
jgi:hypothetical protein